MEKSPGVAVPDNLQDVVVIRDIGAVKEKLRQVKTAGPGAFVVLTDFDSTLTQRYLDHTKNLKCENSWGVFEEGPLISEAAKADLKKRLDHYLPLILSSSKTEEEKEQLQLEWFRADYALLASLKMDQKFLRACLERSTLRFRTGATEVFKSLLKHDKDCFIISAGIKGLIEMSLKTLYERAHLLGAEKKIVVCCTEEEYDSSGVLLQFKDPIVTLSNKGDCFTPEKFPAARLYSTAIVLGDAVEDLKVTKNFKHQFSTVLTIGFDNYLKAEDAERFSHSYDIVIKNDGTLLPVIDILDFLLEDKRDFRSQGLLPLINP